MEWLFFHWRHKGAIITHLELAKFQQVFEDINIDGNLMLFPLNILDKNFTEFLVFQEENECQLPIEEELQQHKK